MRVFNYVNVFDEDHPSQKHPERKPNEVFFTNHDVSDWETIQRIRERYTTTRIGTVAYDIDGNRISNTIVPIFVDREEFERVNKGA